MRVGKPQCSLLQQVSYFTVLTFLYFGKVWNSHISLEVENILFAKNWNTEDGATLPPATPHIPFMKAVQLQARAHLTSPVAPWLHWLPQGRQGAVHSSMTSGGCLVQPSCEVPLRCQDQLCCGACPSRSFLPVRFLALLPVVTSLIAILKTLNFLKSSCHSM